MSADDRYSGPPTSYSEPPLHLREPFLDHVKESARPEGFHGLDFTEPVIDERQHVIITTFDTDPKRRDDGERVPCTLCSHGHPKFLHGALIWSPHDGYLRLVGHQCAAKEEHFGRRYAEMEAAHTALRMVEEAEARLRARLPQIPAMIYRLREAEDPYRSLQHYMRAFQRVAPNFRFRLEEQAKRNGGWLSVERRRAPSLAGGPIGLTTSSAGASDYETAQISVLRGIEFLDLHFRPYDMLVRILSRIEDAIREVPDDDDAEVATEVFLSDLAAERKVELAALFDRSAKEVLDLERKAEAAAAFLTRDNAGAIRRWMDDPDFGAARVDFEVRAGGVKIVQWGEKEHCLLPFMTELPTLRA